MKQVAITLNGNQVAYAERTDYGIYHIYLGINYYTDETLDRIEAYLSRYGVVETTESQHFASPDQMQDSLNAAAYAWGQKRIEQAEHQTAF